MGQICLSPPIFVNKILWEHSHILDVFVYVYDAFLSVMAELQNCIKDPVIFSAQNIDNMVLAGSLWPAGLNDLERKPTVLIKTNLLYFSLDCKIKAWYCVHITVF